VQRAGVRTRLGRVRRLRRRSPGERPCPGDRGGTEAALHEELAACEAARPLLGGLGPDDRRIRVVAPPELVRVTELIRVLLRVELVIEPTHSSSPFPSPSDAALLADRPTEGWGRRVGVCGDARQRITCIQPGSAYVKSGSFRAPSRRRRRGTPRSRTRTETASRRPNPRRRNAARRTPCRSSAGGSTRSSRPRSSAPGGCRRAAG